MNLSDSILNGKKHIHFIGIGGSGMYPLAQILHGQGYYLTGSDNNPTDTLEKVKEMGIPVFLGQRAENIEGADLIVHTAAIMADNPELIAAKESGVPLLERADLLGILTSHFQDALCISGTHGKTTVSSMLTEILLHAGADPTANRYTYSSPPSAAADAWGTPNTWCANRANFATISSNFTPTWLVF